jgi:hypothetical protein
MKNQPTDEQITRRLRAELDAFTAGIPHTPPAALPSTRGATMSPSVNRNRWIASGMTAAGLVALIVGLVLTSGRDDDPAAPADSTTAPVPTASTPTPVTTAPAGPVTTAPAVPPPTTPLTTEPPVPGGSLLEGVGTVIDSGGHVRLCFSTLDSAPPQCGVGVDLAGWSWDAVESEQTSGSTTWTDVAYVTGTYDAATTTLTLASAREATPADYPPVNALDYSVPCEVPAGGWPARNQEWPADDVRTIEGYAGAWVDDSQQVVTIKFTGDLDAATAAVRQFYNDAICVVPAQHTEAELYAIQEQLDSISSVQFLSTAVMVDATGEWVEAGTIAPDPERQASFDAEFGAGTVRLIPSLRPITADGQPLVPVLVGLTEQQARDAATARGFSITVTYREVPAGDLQEAIVIEQSVGPGMPAATGSAIDIVVGQAAQQ